MKARFTVKNRTITVALYLVILPAVLLSSAACTSYDSYTGRQEFDAGRTMAAVGTAALAGSVVRYNNDRRDYYRDSSYRNNYYRTNVYRSNVYRSNYRRPAYHHHYRYRRY